MVAIGDSFVVASTCPTSRSHSPAFGSALSGKADIRVLSQRSDYAVIASIDCDLRASRFCKKRPAQFRSQFRHVLAGDLDLQHIVALVGLDAQAVRRRTLLEDVRRPDAGIEYSVRMQRIDANTVDSPLKSGHARKLLEGCLRRRICSRSGAGRRNIFGADDDAAPAA